ncbi:MAG: hypothetical protein M1591_03320 [Deltaproteobacteria bacterium]|nr:hypothetical protein [Deltaproteobacteria bacterium]
MEIRKVLLISLCFTLLTTARLYAAWSGPTTIVAGTWGTGTTQFGLETGDSPADDHYPHLTGILGNGSIVIDDIINERTELYSGNGVLQDTAIWTEAAQPDGSVIYTKPKYGLGCCEYGYQSNNLIIGGNNYYQEFNSTGTLLTTTTTRPMVLGILSHKITGTSHYARIKYPDGVYFYYYTGETSYFDYASGIIRINTNLIMDVHNNFEPARVYAFTASAIDTPAGQKQQYQLFLNASWQAPQNQYKILKPGSNVYGTEPQESVINEYGQAVIGPDGSIYTYDRSDTDYKIVKWTWTP